MWLITTQGFYSVVADRRNPDRVLIRARSREDLETLRDLIPDLEIHSDRRADYRWRAFISRTEWVAAVAVLASAIDYPNFKDAVAKRQGRGRAELYARIWQLLRRLQEKDR